MARKIAPEIELIGKIFVVTTKVFPNVAKEGHPLFRVNLWIAGRRFPQPAPAFEVGLTDREVRLTNRVPPVMFGVTVSWQGSAGQLELLFMIGSFNPLQRQSGLRVSGILFLNML